MNDASSCAVAGGRLGIGKLMIFLILSFYYYLQKLLTFPNIIFAASNE